MTSVSGLDDGEAAAAAAEFGVALEQVRRDHLISVVLAALAPLAGELVFFGGTALARTYLPHGRLSEDIDLIAVGDRKSIATALPGVIERALRPTHGRVAWSQRLVDIRDTDPAVLSTDDGISVRIQLLRGRDYPPWPTELTDIYQRYAGAVPVRLRTPTRDAFVVSKTATWLDRRAPRDLYDLWALARIGAITSSAAELFVMHGPIRRPPQPWMFASAPTERNWHEQLAGADAPDRGAA